MLYVRSLVVLGVGLFALGCGKSGEKLAELAQAAQSGSAQSSPSVRPLELLPKPVAPVADLDKLYKIGETAGRPDYSLTVSSAKECSSKGYSKPKKDMRWVGVEVTFEGLGDKTFHASPSSSKVTDSEGMVHSWT